MVGRDSPGHFWKISFEVLPRTFEEATPLHEIRRQRERWFVGVHETPAYEIKGPGWWGLRVDSLPIRSGSREIPSVESDAVWVVISSTAGRQTAELLVGNGADDDVLPLLLNTVRFEPRK